MEMKRFHFRNVAGAEKTILLFDKNFKYVAIRDSQHHKRLPFAEHCIIGIPAIAKNILSRGKFRFPAQGDS